MEAFAYREIATPTFEQTGLFARSIGEETDIVSKEMYSFKDQGGREITLRPEATAPVVRAYLQQSLGAQRPLQKLFYIGPMYRQENPQKGRLRQFHQFGVEAIGSPDAALDVEVITLLLEVCRRLGLENLTLQLGSVGCPACRPGHRDALRGFLGDKLPDLCADCRVRYDRNPLRILDCKEASCQALTQGAPAMLDFLCAACKEHFEEVAAYMDRLSVGCRINRRLARGLDYYTRTVFEVTSTDLGAQAAVGGGGRYDGLVEMLGGQATPAVGFACGIERLILAVEAAEAAPPAEEGPRILVVNLGSPARRRAVQVVDGLRRRGISCDMDYLGRSLKAQLKAADRMGARYALIIGDQELETGQAVLRDMAGSAQETVPLADIVDTLGERLS